VVKKGTQTNYVIGSKSAKEGTNAGSVTKYKSLSSDKKKKYDKKEKTMINQAYNTYNTVLNAEGVVLVQGYVYDDGDDAVEDTLVSLNLSGDNAYLYYTYTDSEGLYSIYVPSTNHEYEMHFSCDGYGDVTMYNIEPGEQALGDYQTAVYMVKPDTNYEVTLSMKDALNYNSSHTDMVVLGHSTYYIRQGINSKDGEVVATGNADTAGVAKLSLPGGMYTVEIEESGYNIAFFSLVVGDEHRTGQYYLSPELDSGEIRIVLTWNDTPGDLDSHLFTPYCSTEEHISYYHQTDGTNSLDVDVTTGYGPETITIKDLETVGIYKYYVADYTDCLQNDFTSKNMSYSNATVRIYTEEGLYTSFSVPTNREGVIWEVFEIRNGKVVPAQRYYKAVEDKDWWKNK
jgi:hypothetical protein